MHCSEDGGGIMVDESQFHRDFYTGLLASKLDKEGYFENLYQLYGFLYWQDGKTGFIYTDDRQQCCLDYLAYQRKGAVLTMMIQWQQKFSEIASYTSAQLQQQAAEGLRQALERQQGTTFKEAIVKAEAGAENQLDGEVWQQYFTKAAQKSTILQKQALQNLLTVAAQQQLLCQELLLSLQQVVNALPQKKVSLGIDVYGFAYWDNDRWMYCHSLFLPIVLEQWQQCQQAGTAATMILDGRYYQKDRPAYVLEEQFAQELEKTLDTDYLALYQQILDKTCR